jgi:hypothetical protein
MQFKQCQLIYGKLVMKLRIEEIKERFVAKGGDGEIFDQATALNAKDQEINDLIYAKVNLHADKALLWIME